MAKCSFGAKPMKPSGHSHETEWPGSRVRLGRDSRGWSEQQPRGKAKRVRDSDHK